MRFLTWNIKQGGGVQIPKICRHIGEVDAELGALTEFQAPNETALRDAIDDCAIVHAPRTAGISDHASLVAT